LAQIRGEQIRFGSVFTRKKQPNRKKKKRPETEPEPAQTGQFRSGFGPVFYPKKPDKPIGLFWAYFGLFNRLFNGLLMDFY
jgi:hypothetical protein